MVSGGQNPVVRYLRRLAGAPPSGDPSDEELLQRFARHRDEDAFTIIVEKYGPMVLGVCRRILHNSQDVEDAFQATFLVLVRKACSLRQPGSLAAWLYGVASRTAIKARALAAQRRFHEAQAMNAQASQPVQETRSSDLKELLDQEVNQLPAKYRKALTLCYFAGLTNEEAARCLSCPPGTVFSRLARGREMLRARLARRGLVISAAGLAGTLTAETTRAAVSASLADATVKSALAFAAGDALAAATVSATVLTLTKGVQQAMLFNTLKIILAVGLAATVVSGTGVTYLVLAHDPTQAEKRPNKQATAPKEGTDDKTKREEETIKKKDDDRKAKVETLKKYEAELNMRRLLQDRVEAAKKEFQARMQQFEAGKGTLDFLIAASKRLLTAETEDVNQGKSILGPLQSGVLPLPPLRGPFLAPFQAHFERMKKIQDINQERFDQGRMSIEDLAQAKYYRLEAEIWLERAKAGGSKSDLDR